MSDYKDVTGFHTHSNLFFRRLKDGSVVVEKWTQEQPFTIQSSITLTPETWASVVASMSLEGENGKTFNEALERQTGQSQ